MLNKYVANIDESGDTPTLQSGTELPLLAELEEDPYFREDEEDDDEESFPEQEEDEDDDDDEQAAGLRFTGEYIGGTPLTLIADEYAPDEEEEEEDLSIREEEEEDDEDSSLRVSDDEQYAEADKKDSKVRTVPITGHTETAQFGCTLGDDGECTLTIAVAVDLEKGTLEIGALDDAVAKQLK